MSQKRAYGALFISFGSGKGSFWRCFVSGGWGLCASAAAPKAASGPAAFEKGAGLGGDQRRRTREQVSGFLGRVKTTGRFCLWAGKAHSAEPDGETRWNGRSSSQRSPEGGLLIKACQDARSHNGSHSLFKWIFVIFRAENPKMCAAHQNGRQLCPFSP